MQELHTDNLEAACNGSKSYEKEIDDGKGQQENVEAITSMDVDFAQWYTDVVKKAELIDYSAVKGCMIIRPAGYAIWEIIQKELDRRFKETGVRECIYAHVHSGEPSGKRKGSCRRIRARGCMGNLWWFAEAPGASVRSPDF